jgi:hypothetical protein
MVDLLGYGTNAPNVITNRPADDRILGGVDTWGKKCSSPNAGDGTGILAGFTNGLLGQLRALIRGNGQSALLADIVAIDNSDDTMMLKAIQHLIQRGQMKFAFDTGPANAMVVALNPAPAEYKTGMSIRVLVGHDNTGPCTINVNGLGLRAVLRKGTGALQPRDLVGGGFATLDYDGGEFQLADLPASYSNASRIVTSSAALNLTLQDRAIALLRTAGVAAMTINLPAGASNGHVAIIDDVSGSLFAANANVVAPPGETIAQAADYKMDRDFQSTSFRFYTDGVTRIWSRST